MYSVGKKNASSSARRSDDRNTHMPDLDAGNLKKASTTGSRGFEKLMEPRGAAERLQSERAKAFKTLQTSSSGGRSALGDFSTSPLADGKSYANVFTTFEKSSYEKKSSKERPSRTSLPDMMKIRSPTKAIKTLERPPLGHRHASKELSEISLDDILNDNSLSSLGLNYTSRKSRSDNHKTQNKKDSFNISDLYADHTISLIEHPSSERKQTLSFEPSEITGRSTMCLPGKKPPSGKTTPSVKDILANSSVDELRNLSETLQVGCVSASLIRTVDNIPDRDLSIASNQASEDSLFGESFKSASRMESQLAADERAWEDQFADVPSRYKTDVSTNSILEAQNGNFSASSFFNKNSTNIQNLLNCMESPPKRPPVAVVQEDSMISHIEEQAHSKSSTKDKGILSSLSVMDIEKVLRELRLNDSMQSADINMSEMSKNLNKDNYVRESSFGGRKYESGKRKTAEKENLSPYRQKNHQLAETVTGTDSLFDLSENIEPDSSFTKKLMESNLLRPSPPGLPRTRKRSHSSTRIDSDTIDQEVPNRRSRSPSTHVELAAASGCQTSNKGHSAYEKDFLVPAHSSEYAMTENDHKYLLGSNSPDCGKFSLPHGAVMRTASTFSDGALKSRCNSQCSTSSEFSHNGGRLPLKATAVELTWSCVKLRHTTEKRIQIKNVSNKRLIVRAEIVGPGFQLGRSTDDASNLVLLQAYECRTLHVNFCPTVIGPAAGQLVFSSPHGNGSMPHKINLYGYGGHSHIFHRGVLKGPVGAPYLPLGELRQISGYLETSFFFYNKGPITGFVCIVVDSMGLDLPHLCDCISVNPKSALIKPESNVEITVTFRPRREDLKKIYKKLKSKDLEVIVLATLKIICGEDVSRRQVRNLIHQMNESEREAFQNAPPIMWNRLSGEEPTDDFDNIRNKVESATELLSGLRSHEIVLTLHHSMPEKTLQDTLLLSETDATVLFRTMVSDSSFSGSTRSNSPDVQRNSVESWSIRPKQIEINSADDATNEAVFVIHSNFYLRKQFRIDSSARHVLQCSPDDGNLMPGESVSVKVRMRNVFLPTEQLKITVHVDDSKIVIPVIIKKDNISSHLP